MCYIAGATATRHACYFKMFRFHRDASFNKGVNETYALIREAPGHVREFMVLTGNRRCLDRLQRHAADRAIARPHLTDLRVHRASVDCARLDRGRRHDGDQSAGVSVSHR